MYAAVTFVTISKSISSYDEDNLLWQRLICICKLLWSMRRESDHTFSTYDLTLGLTQGALSAHRAHPCVELKTYGFMINPNPILATFCALGYFDRQ